MKGGNLLVKGGLVWNGEGFERKDLFVLNGVFVEQEKLLPDAEIVDARGLYVFPGFVDSHAHVTGTGLRELTFDLSSCRLSDVLRKVKSTDSKYVIARGWTELPTAEELRLANTFEGPVFLVRKCGHVAWVNDWLRRMLGLESNLIVEDQLRRVWESFGDELYEEAFRKGVELFLSHGVTQVHSDDYNGPTFEKLKELLLSSKIRIFEKLNTTEPWRYEFGRLGLSEIGAVKVFADGSIGGRTAYMLEPYADTGTLGVSTLPANFEEIVAFAESKGLQVCVHTIGDRALRQVLDVFEKVRPKLRHRLIHLQFVSRADFGRLGKFHLSVQPHFFFEDEPILKNVKYELAYPYLEMYEAGYDIAFSSDSPVSPADPRYVLESALRMGFRLSDAVKLYTEAGPRMFGRVGLKAGRLEIGYLADFALYERPPLEDRPLAVFVNGTLSYSSD